MRDGGSSDSPIMGTYCGPQMPDPLTTTSNFMYLKFVTDGSVQNNGFEASYEIAEGGKVEKSFFISNNFNSFHAGFLNRVVLRIAKSPLFWPFRV